MISIGYLVIFGIIFLPLYIAVLAAFLGKPRQSKLAVFTYGAALGLTVMALIGIWIFGFLVSFFIP